jgi:membrane-associated phospholipid phosphatase
MLLFNLLIIFSAISESGHYLVDLLAGLLPGVMAIAFIPPAKAAFQKTKA